MSDELPDDAAPAAAAQQDLPDDHDAGPSPAEEADALLDKALERMGLGGGDDDDDAPPPKAHPKMGGKKGEKKPARDADESDDDEDDDEEPSPRRRRQEDDDDEDDDLESREDADEDDLDDEDESDEEEDEDIALHRAYTTLHDKVGVPSSVLKSMPRSKLIAWAKRVEAGQAGAATGASSSAERGRGTPEGAKASGASSSGGGESAAAAADSATTWATLRAGIAKTLGVDDEAAEGLKPMHDALEAANARADALEQKLDEFRRESLEREGRRMIDAEVRRLAKSHPGLLDDDEKVSKLTKRAVRIAKVAREEGETITPRQAFNEAAEKVLGRSKRIDAALRRNGVSTAPERRGRGFSGQDMDEDSTWIQMTDAALDGNRQRIGKLARNLPRDSKPKR